jgi:hypothetical protein
MRILLPILLVTMSLSICLGQVRVRGYYRKDGTYVRPHYRSNPDGNPYNNWSYPGNTNPYTGKAAGGNPETYLANYYKTKSSYNRTYYVYDSDKFDDYYTLTNLTDYRGMSDYNNYYTSKGSIVYDSKRKFKLYDNSNTYVGYVKMSMSRKKFTIYDIEGYKIFSNKDNILLWTLLAGGIITTAVVYSSDVE